MSRNGLVAKVNFHRFHFDSLYLKMAWRYVKFDPHVESSQENLLSHRKNRMSIAALDREIFHFKVLEVY